MNGAAIVVAVLAVCLFLFMPLRTNSPVKISCFGPTNNPVAGLLFVFSVTNESAYEIRLAPLSPEIISHGVATPVARLASITTSNLPPHSAQIFVVAAVPSGSTWCQPVIWAYDKPFLVEYLRDFLMDNIRQNVWLLSQGKAPGLNGGNHIHFQWVCSPEMKN